MDPLNPTAPAPSAPAPESLPLQPLTPAGAVPVVTAPAQTPPAPAAPMSSPTAAADAAKAAGLDMAALSRAWSERGDLSEEDYKKFEDAGITREVVKAGCQAIATQNQAKVETYRAAASEHVGGTENLKALKEFFIQTKGIPEDRKAEIESMIRLDNITSTKAALTEIRDAYEAEYGTTGNPVDGSRSVGGGDVFATLADQNKVIIGAQRSGDQSTLNTALDKAARTAAHNRKAGIKW